VAAERGGYKFKSWDQWSAKPGFMVLSKVTTNTDGGTRPVNYLREWSNFRSFYTTPGHEGPTYQDAHFIKHVAAGLMSAVRREALFRPYPPRRGGLRSHPTRRRVYGRSTSGMDKPPSRRLIVTAFMVAAQVALQRLASRQGDFSLGPESQQ
jgi:hypothetical protein